MGNGLTLSPVARAIKTKTVKTVRIISPHSAEEHDPIPDEVYDTPRRTFFSPPPDPTVLENSEDDSPDDPFVADAEGAGSGTEDEGVPEDSLVKTPVKQQSQQASLGMPVNPFKKTLANLETQELSNSVRSITESKPSGVSDTPVRQYDVEDFKKLLLTGEKNTSKSNSTTSAPPVSFSQIPNGDSNSNTDTSSAYQQSLFERTSSTRLESPQTSRESSISIDVQQQTPEASDLQSSKSKPTTPIHRHGKPMQGHRPQIASFEDPSLSISRTAADTPSSGDPNIPLSPSSPSDKNKALPALPLASSSKFSVSDQTRSRPEPYAESKDSDASAYPPKKPVPAPPPSRRTRPISVASVNSGRSVAISEEGSKEPTQFASSPPSRASTAPAPPPPRRSNTLRGDSSSSVPTVASNPSVSDQHDSRDQSPTQPQSARAPLPLTRSPSITASKGGSNASPASGSPSMGASQPPPPPPPRRRGSSQSSNHYIPSRLSGSYTMPMQERLRSDSGASSISQLAMTNNEPSADQKLEQKDVLADLTALQREVDELRGKIR